MSDAVAKSDDIEWHTKLKHSVMDRIVIVD